MIVEIKDFQNPEYWKNSSISDFLMNAEIEKIETVDDFFAKYHHVVRHTEEVDIILFKNGIKGVFKPKREKDIYSIYSEIGAYKASCFLMFPYIPPTVLRIIQGTLGSLQLFSDSVLLKENNDIADKLNKAHHKDIIALKTFNFIFGQWDTSTNNILEKNYNNKTYLISIDNEHIITKQHVRYGESPFVASIYSEKLQSNDFEKSFPFDDVIEIKNPTKEKIKQYFGDKLPQWWYDKIHVNLLKNQPFRFVIYRNIIWRQRYIDKMIPDVDFVSLHVPHITQFIYDQIKKLTHETLKEVIFIDAVNANAIEDEYISLVLNRRNMVLSNAVVID